MKKITEAAILAIMCAVSAFAAEAEPAPSAPELSHGGGVYSSAITLEISGEGNIFYTTNGDEPTIKSALYTKPLLIEGDFASPRSVQGYVAQEQVPQGVTVRAAAISDSGEMSEIVTETYFIGEVCEFYELPLVNITVDSYDLWSPHEGIYQNYNYEHNVPAYFEYFTKDGEAGPERAVEVKVSGHGSRSSAKKSLRLYFNKGDTSAGKYLEYNIIPDARKNSEDSSPVTKFGKITMRISDWSGSNLRDPLAQRIASFTRADIAASEPVALFLNGEFWGVYECREQYDERFVQHHYGVDNDDVVFLDRDWTLSPETLVLPDTGRAYTDKLEYSSGPEDSNKNGYLGQSYYREQWDYVKSLAEERDITDDKVYAEFCANVDVDNYIDFLITYIYAGNDDWPGNNFKLWRITEEKLDSSIYGADGKWRFMVHDFDISFENANHETLYLSALEKGAPTDARHPEFATAMLGGLLKNEDFRNEFAQRTMAYLSTAMSKENINSLVDGLAAERSIGKEHDLLRWNLGGGGSTESRMRSWLSSLDSFRSFAEKRPARLQAQYIKLLNENYSAGITGTANFSFKGAQFTINGARITSELYGEKADDFTTVQFAGIPVKISAVNENGERASKIIVTHGGITEEFYAEAEFVPTSADYSVTAEFEYQTSANKFPVGIMRSERFKKMKLGEKLPAVLYTSQGERVIPEVETRGGVVRCENGIVEAVAEGTGVIRMSGGGAIFETEVIVTK